MIEIELENEKEPLDLLKDTSIEIVLENPLLGNTDKLSPGSYSIPFSLPGGESSPKNARQLRNPDLIENAQPYLPKKAKIKYDSIPFKEGTINIDEIDSTRIETYFLFGLGTLKDDLKTKRIRDLLNETVDLGSVSYTKRIRIVINANDPDTTVTINGNEYQAVIEEDEVVTSIFQQIVDAADVDGDVIMAELDPETPENTEGYYGFFITRGTKTGATYIPSTDPLIELALTVTKGNDYAYHVEHNMEEYYAALHSMLSPYFLNNADPRIFFPYHSNSNLHDFNDILYSTFVNLYGNESIQFWERVIVSGTLNFYPGVTFQRQRVEGLHSLRPFINVKVVLDKILEFLGVGIEGDFYDLLQREASVWNPETGTTVPRFVQMGLDNSFVLDVLQDFCPMNIHPDLRYFASQEKTKWIFFQTSFNLSELVPDMTVVDFLKAFAIRYNLAVYQNERSGNLVMQLREPIATDNSYENIDSISGRKGKIKNEQITGYSLTIAASDTDTNSKAEKVSVGVPKAEIPIPCAAFHTTFTDRTQVGSRMGVWMIRRARAKFGLRILWNWGLEVGSDPYPRAQVSGGLFWNENLQDIHEQFHKYWMLFNMNKRTVPLMINWTLRQLLRFDWRLKRRYNGSDFLVKSITLRLTTRGLQVSETELITQR